MIPVTECRTGAEVRALAARFRRAVNTPVVNISAALPAENAPLPVNNRLRPVVRVTVLDPDVRPILIAVCKEYRLTYRTLIGKAVSRHISRARQDAAYRLRTQLGRSLPAIGRVLRRDYTTVRHGIAAHALRNSLPLPDNTGLSWSIRHRGVRP